ncbi:hypothetical protein WH47_01447 [Habropoda laboriosa]|uniref:Mos1 transposase HTH domain-containing protein n=1 Tax=Habropoda laboriosa TaxID=597456 RepID=A0A0L7R5H8_9HYME|nr:hypothetical protein WH47_01447 [Habropoda laboriosa]
MRHCILYAHNQGKTAAVVCKSVCSFLGKNIVLTIVNVQVALENVVTKNCKSY